jgi:polyhydroxyalkanoate synthesis regulator phasin
MFEDVRKYIEAAVETLSPANAQRLAKSMAPDAAKDQVSKVAQDLVEWSQRNRERLRAFVAREVKDQLSAMGVATRTEVDALKKRVRDLERSTGGTVAGGKPTAKRPAAKRQTVGSRTQPPGAAAKKPARAAAKRTSSKG